MRKLINYSIPGIWDNDKFCSYSRRSLKSLVEWFWPMHVAPASDSGKGVLLKLVVQ